MSDAAFLPHIPGFRIVRPLGSGASSDVYLAVQDELEREVALKVLTVEAIGTRTGKRRLVREVRSLAKLSSPHIVRLYSHDLLGTPPWIALELLPAGSLATQLEHARRGLPPDRVLRLARELLTGLKDLHDAGLVHRDVKPANIAFRDDGTAVLTDLGIARSFIANETRVTGTGMVLGTLPYLPPEALAGEEVDARCDLFALGITLYEALTGRHPSEHRVVRADFCPAWSPDLRAAAPALLLALVEGLSRGDVARRIPSAAAGLEMLDRSERPAPAHGRDRSRSPERRGASARSFGPALPAIMLAGVLLAWALSDTWRAEQVSTPHFPE